MAGLVIDSSIALSWILPDEDVADGDRVRRTVAEDGAIAAVHWSLEVANALLMAVRRGRIDRDFRKAALSDLADLRISLDGETSGQAWGETLRLADEHGLTIYDAAYLELAGRRALPLATLDRKLGPAAEEAGIAVLGASTKEAQ